MMIEPAETNDLPQIYALFEEAIAYIRENNFVGWTTYDRAFIQQDLASGQLFRIVKEGAITGIFSICYADPLIWREREKGDALYLHRIVANRRCKEPVFDIVLEWAVEFARFKGLRYLRMDTWANNPRIIAYYERFGFCRLGDYTTPDTTDLPAQHRNLHVALLEKII